MFERFTDRARRAVTLATDEARAAGHREVRTADLLAGLMDEDCGVAFQALSALGLTLASIRDAAAGNLPAAFPRPAGHLAFSARLKKVTELALRESLQLGCNYIGTEHLLLGLVRDRDCTGAGVLGVLGVSLPDVRAKVLELLSGYEKQGVSEQQPDLSSLPPGKLIDAYQSGLAELAAAWQEVIDLTRAVEEKTRVAYKIEARVRAIGNRRDALLGKDGPDGS